MGEGIRNTLDESSPGISFSIPQQQHSSFLHSLPTSPRLVDISYILSLDVSILLSTVAS